ncbi:TadE family type IV pilus minor pilin [Qaidamihabitans albus]|uniref:TadE family type IV pilus minor pilin n=1 Tax=Qaidamihabitans albus TaxID=2795733 RepID=UPI0018F13DEB|nr:TadE family type IV pilus minor pilin [Qaidamihabitans albus]
MAEHLAADRGAVTVEAAIALCSLVAVFGLVLAGVAAVSDQLRCSDAAAEAARLAARGQGALAEQTARARAPDGATVEIREEGGIVAVTVRADSVGGLLPGVTVRGEAHAVPEPGAEVAGDAVP